jgi:Putative peptidoglycan binding domain
MPYGRSEVMLFPEPGLAHPFEYQYRTDKARNMDDCGTHLCSFMLAAVDQLFAQDMIQLAQTQLKMAGFHLGRTDGVFDMLTADPVRKYQVANGIPVCGLLDEPSIHIRSPASRIRDLSEDHGHGHGGLRAVWCSPRASLPGDRHGRSSFDNPLFPLTDPIAPSLLPPELRPVSC